MGHHGHHHEDDDCGISEGRAHDYDMAMHIVALVVIGLLSLLGCAIPVVGRKFTALRINETVLQLLMAFGVGVVIATALIHMIPPAIEKLNNPCLGIEEKYEALAMAIVLGTILLMMMIETEMGIAQTKEASAMEVAEAGHVKTPPNQQPDVESAGFQIHGHAHGNAHGHDHHAHGHAHGLPLLPSENGSTNNLSVRNYVSTIIFECGVYMHSILIGLDLGVLAGSDFTALFVAVSFHQFFEGVAVGNVATMAFTSTRATVTSVVLYSLMTPFGILLGILISSSYSETSTTALWVQGSLDAVAGGILLYTGLVELLSCQYISNPLFQKQSSQLRSATYGFLLLGAFAMALIGKWA